MIANSAFLHGNYDTRLSATAGAFLVAVGRRDLPLGRLAVLGGQETASTRLAPKDNSVGHCHLPFLLVALVQSIWQVAS
jgi:hypothetical protein